MNTIVSFKRYKEHYGIHSMKNLSSPAEIALQQLGEYLQIARKSRRWTQAEVQARTGLSRVTIRRIEQGYPGVTMGNLATLLALYGRVEALAHIIEPEQDLLALNFDLPRRIRQSRKEYDNDF